MFQLAENMKIVNLLAPAADAAGRTGAYVSLKNAIKAWIVVNVTQGNAATIALDPLQATAVAGTGSKALTNNTRIWSNLDTAAGDTLVARTAAKTYTTDAGVKLKQVIFEIDPAACMDIAGGFDCISVSTGASNAANITEAQLFILNKYSGAVDTIPSAVAD